VSTWSSAAGEGGGGVSILIARASVETARQFLDAWHPLMAGGSLSGQKRIYAGYEDNSPFPSFVAVFCAPRSRWRKTHVDLELTRLAWSSLAVRSAVTFLRKVMRQRELRGMAIVTYALPGTEGKLYIDSGFDPFGTSSGSSWSKRGPGERLTPPTIGEGKKLLRFLVAA
jgi:hypothetical protein